MVLVMIPAAPRSIQILRSSGSPASQIAGPTPWRRADSAGPGDGPVPLVTVLRAVVAIVVDSLSASKFGPESRIGHARGPGAYARRRTPDPNPAHMQSLRPGAGDRRHCLKTQASWARPQRRRPRRRITESDMARILIVDDSPEVRVALTATLEDAGHTVIEASDGREAVAQAAAIQPDAIVLDINMPDLDGIGALRAIRADRLTRDVPVVMLTAVADLDHIQTAIAAGAQDYILKPWDADTVIQRLWNAMESRRLKAENPESRAEVRRGLSAGSTRPTDPPPTTAG